MRLPDEVQQCVVFLGRTELDRKTRSENVVYGGTGFLVSEPSTVQSANFIHLVTARHVAEKINDGQFFIRMNGNDGKAIVETVDAGVDFKWWFHPDKSVDVAVMRWLPPKGSACKSISIDMFLTPEKIRAKGIGPGDECYVIGLFRFVQGQKRILPIVRTGSVSMIPDERIPLTGWHTPDMEAYLIEGRSIGGLSGSPVFAQRSIEVQETEHTGRKPLAAGAIFFLGLIHGHWDTPKDKIDYAWDDEAGGRDQINVGIAIVAPAHHVMEAISQPELAKEKLQSESALLEQPHILDGGSPLSVWPGKEHAANTILSVGVSAASITNGQVRDDGFTREPPDHDDSSQHHKEDFTALLNAAAKTKK